MEPVELKFHQDDCNFSTLHFQSNTRLSSACFPKIQNPHHQLNSPAVLVVFLDVQGSYSNHQSDDVFSVHFLHRLFTLGILEIMIAITFICISLYCFDRFDHANIFLFIFAFYVVSVAIPVYGLIYGVYQMQLKPTRVII